MTASSSSSSPPPPATTTTESSSTKHSRLKGTSILPTARVQRIIKIDRDVDLCSKEASFLISIATELFIKKLSQEAFLLAHLEKRKIIQYKDLAKAVEQNEYLDFLQQAIPSPMTLSSALTKREQKLEQIAEMEAKILDGTLEEEEEEEEEMISEQQQQPIKSTFISSSSSSVNGDEEEQQPIERVSFDSDTLIPDQSMY